jgi:hypothetical protein
MADELEFVIDELAFHIAHADPQKAVEAERLIRRLITRAPGISRRRRAI